MTSRKALISLAAIAVASSALLAACGGSSETTATPSASPVVSSLPSFSALPSAEPTMASEPPMVGGDPSTWSPMNITMDMNGTTVKLIKGQTAIFTDLPANDATNKIVVVAKKKGIVKITQQGADGDAITVAGLTGLKKGKTKITVYDGDPKSKSAIVVMQFTVKVKKATPANIAAAADALLNAAGVESATDSAADSAASPAASAQ